MRLLSAIVLGLGLVLGSTVAEAGKRVDWSNFIEEPGAAPVTKTTGPSKAERSAKVVAEKPAKREKVTKRSGKAKRSAVKARAKAKKRARK